MQEGLMKWMNTGNVKLSTIKKEGFNVHEDELAN
jgi:hypothetical protein